MEEKEKKEEREGGGEGGREERRGNEEEKEEDEEERERGGEERKTGRVVYPKGFFSPRNIAVYSAWWYFGSWGLVPSASPQCWTLGEVTVS